jgi:hypothetical protein
MLDLIFFTCRRRRRQRALGQLASSRCRTSAKCVNQHQSCDSVRAFEFIMHDGSEQFNVPQVHAMTALSDSTKQVLRVSKVERPCCRADRSSFPRAAEDFLSRFQRPGHLQTNRFIL